MYWQAPMLDRWIEPDALRRAFISAFGLDEACITVIDFPNRWTGPIPPEPRIHLESVHRAGPFPQQLNVFIGGDEIARLVADLTGTLDYARALARALNVTMLLGDGPIGHEEQLRVTPDGTVDIVELDGDELDEERYVIVGSRPFTELPASATTAAAG